jgi:hypothetical protein
VTVRSRREVVARLAEVECPEEKFGQEEIGDKDDDGGFDESGDGGAADALGAAFDAQALMAADGRDDEAEDERLEEADDDVTELEGVDGAGPELSGGNVECELCDGESADEAGADAESGQDRHDEDGGDEARSHEFADGVDAEGADGVDLIGDDHRSEFGGHGGGVAAGDEECGEDGAEFAEESERDGVGGEGGFAEAAKLAGSVEDDDASDAGERDENDAERADADDVHLFDQVGKITIGGERAFDRAEDEEEIVLNDECSLFEVVLDAGADGKGIHRAFLRFVRRVMGHPVGILLRVGG